MDQLRRRAAVHPGECRGAAEPGIAGGRGGSPVTAGVVLGLVVGKLVGVGGAAWLALRLRAGRLPIGVTSGQLAAVAGIGFTMSLFIAGLAYPAPELQDQARVGILAGSLLAAAVGTLLLRGSLSSPAAAGGVPQKEDR